ncbi:MAG: GFA family protein [Alphaproteobacteria bacterium]|jgi:hypothetical protein|nr:GFA family protein [Alphaproteobacteria bacterium]HJP22664.1 GFA family protein [Alphaproteobacteria bacterium]
MKTYRGSCHCGQVVFEIESALEQFAICNCSICRRKGALMHRVPADHFRLLEGENALTTYQFNTGTATHYFCRHCGIYPFHRPRVAPDAYSVNVNCLDLEPDEIAKVPVEKFDGQSFSTLE